MRMGNSFLGVWLLLTSATAWAQGAPREPKAEEKKPETEAYYLISRDGEDIGWFRTEASRDERGRTTIAIAQQAPQDALLDVQELLPSTREQPERIDLQVEARRTIVLSDEFTMLEDHISLNSSLDDLQLNGKYENGRWTIDLHVRGATPRSVREGETPPAPPPLLMLFLHGVNVADLKVGATSTFKIHRMGKSGSPAVQEFEGTVKEAGSRPRFDGTDGDFVLLEIVFAGVELPWKLWITTDGYLDEMQVRDLAYKRVTKDELGAIAGWLADGRRDIFESSLAVKIIGETEVDDPNKKKATPEVIQKEIDRISEGLTLLQASAADPLKQLDLARGLLERIRRLRERKEIETMAAVQADLNALEEKIKRTVPRESMVDLAEAQIIAGEIEDILAKDTPDAVLKAERKLDELEAIAERPTMKGSPEEPKMKDLVQLANFAIGKTVLFKYIKGFEVRGLIYRRDDRPDQVRFSGSLLGVPMTLDESVHVLRPRGHCLLTNRGKTKTYREGDILETASKQVIRVKSVLKNGVILEGRGAEVELKYPPQDETARD